MDRPKCKIVLVNGLNLIIPTSNTWTWHAQIPLKIFNSSKNIKLKHLPFWKINLVCCFLWCSLFTRITSKCSWRRIYLDSARCRAQTAKFGSKRPPLFNQSVCHRRAELPCQSIGVGSGSLLNGHTKSDLYVRPQYVGFWRNEEHKRALSRHLLERGLAVVIK